MKVLIAKFVQDPSAFIILSNEVADPAADPATRDRCVIARLYDDAPEVSFRVDSKLLRDFLNARLPALKSGTADIQKYVLNPMAPQTRGEIVTVIQSPNFDGAGEPHVVVDFESGFAHPMSLDAAGNRTRSLSSINATVKLALTDIDGDTIVQVVPVWALRPWTDPAANSNALEGTYEDLREKRDALRYERDTLKARL